MTEQVAELSWIPDYLDDLDADFRVLYRIDGIADGQFGDLSAARFIALAERTFAFDGVMTARARAEQQEDQGPPAVPSPASARQPRAGSSSRGEPARVVGSTRAELMADPVLSSVIDFG